MVSADLRSRWSPFFTTFDSGTGSIAKKGDSPWIAQRDPGAMPVSNLIPQSCHPELRRRLEIDAINGDAVDVYG
jgi:hypothetical protein